VCYLLLIAVVLPLRLAAADFCAVYVNVTTTNGRPSDAPVALIDQDGSVETSTTAQQGKAVLCDIGFGSHTIRIGDAKCAGYVTIHNVSLIYGVPQTFTAVWDGCRYIDGMTIPPSCPAAFRVTSQDGKKLTDAEATQPGNATTYHADSYGRFFLAVSNGSVKNFTFSAPGYEPQVVKVSCQGYENIEKSVQMTTK
jgi:hypothetical protein